MYVCHQHLLLLINQIIGEFHLHFGVIRKKIIKITTGFGKITVIYQTNDCPVLEGGGIILMSPIKHLRRFFKRTCIRQEILSKPPGAERRERQIGGQCPAASRTSGSESPATHSHGLYCTTRPETKGDPEDKYNSLYFLKPHANP